MVIFMYMGGVIAGIVAIIYYNCKSSDSPALESKCLSNMVMEK